jgi:hypothetical protein
MKYRKKPVVVEAIRYTGMLTCQEIYDWAGIPYEVGEEPKPKPFKFITGMIVIDTLEGFMTASPGDWIIKGVKGEFYPCKPDIFAMTYEPAPE